MFFCSFCIVYIYISINMPWILIFNTMLRIVHYKYSFKIKKKNMYLYIYQYIYIYFLIKTITLVYYVIRSKLLQMGLFFCCFFWSDLRIRPISSFSFHRFFSLTLIFFAFSLWHIKKMVIWFFFSWIFWNCIWFD